MPIDPRARRLLSLLAASPRGRDEEAVAALRRASDALADFASAPPAVERRDLALDLPGRRLAARAYAPRASGSTPLPGLVYFHGGGLVAGGIASHDSLVAELAAGARCRIVAVAYRLAPEHRFPAAHDDAAEALRHIAANPADFGLDPGRLGVAGDSSGGGLAASAALRVEATLKLLFLLCPALDPLAREPSRSRLGQGGLIEEATFEFFWRLYRIEGLSCDDPRVAPRRAGGLARLPPTRVHIAEFDPLKDEGRAFARAVAEAGREAQVVEHAGMIHHFYGLTGFIPASRPALASICEDLARGLG